MVSVVVLLFGQFGAKSNFLFEICVFADGAHYIVILITLQTTQLKHALLEHRFAVECVHKFTVYKIQIHVCSREAHRRGRDLFDLEVGCLVEFELDGHSNGALAVRLIEGALSGLSNYVDIAVDKWLLRRVFSENLVHVSPVLLSMMYWGFI